MVRHPHGQHGCDWPRRTGAHCRCGQRYGVSARNRGLKAPSLSLALVTPILFGPRASPPAPPPMGSILEACSAGIQHGSEAAVTEVTRPSVVIAKTDGPRRHRARGLDARRLD